ncbi:MAG: hypothetical protein CVV24_05230 [Ignavibacteriae bacterium HGW-Ignavibacteriae-3]|nr:MAG: hypothetical protein CVV24_05230 [Ignavibacteriae bacterium HGW-Ignavibacteriae-3]
MKKIFTNFLFVWFMAFAFVFAQNDQDSEAKRAAEAKTPEFKFIGYWFSRGTASDVAPTNELLRGQIIGRLFGPNTTNTHNKTALYFEQRFVPMFIYTPSILDGVATFRSLFKIDMTWGDAAYGVGGNTGGGINAGQVNLQTLLANVDIRPKDADWNLVVGLQRIFDNVRDPNINAVSTAQTSSYKLSYWGTQGVGLSMFANLSPTTQSRFGYYQLYENIIQENDDVGLWMFDIESRVHPLLEIGADAWYLWDRGKNSGGISVLGQGLNSGLAEYNGAVRVNFPTQRYEANIFWLGTHASYNRDFMAGRWWADGYVMSNFGSIDTVSAKDKSSNYAGIFGVSANAMLAYKYGMTANDKISVEALFTSGDGNGASDGTLNSVITGNVWGSPTGIYSSHKALLLFPDPQVVNRYYSAVHDISNMGFGVTAGFISVVKDLIPNKLSGKLGFATALSNVTPKGGSSYIGSEVNVEFKYNIKVFLTVGVSAGYLMLGDFYNAPSVTYDKLRPKDPWVIFTSLSWLMF